MELKRAALIFILLLVWDQKCSAAEMEALKKYEPGKRKEFIKYSSNFPRLQATGSNPAIFNVLRFGAKGDGKTDETKAFGATWAAACKVASSTMLIPSGFVFLVGPITFAGPGCKPNIIFQLDGKIIAPTSWGPWGSGLLQWLNFKSLIGITIRGKGVIDGQGSIWWGTSKSSNGGKMPSTKPTALRFYGSSGITVTGITIQRSPQTHLKFDSCTKVQVSYIIISSPGYSPNTDGIHLQNSKDVSISRTSMVCGDDCISIQTGCSNVLIQDVSCALGHGISIGALGVGNTKACVSNVVVQDVTLLNTMTGVRIKTWQGGSGSVQGILFSNIQVSEVNIPIVIDQYYCQTSKCKNQTSAVAISGVKYENIRGTYTEQALSFACSDSLPCNGLSLSNIELQPFRQGSSGDDAFCWKAYGVYRTPTLNQINCLSYGRPSNTEVQSYFVNSC